MKTRPLELVHTDVMGPMKTKSKGGARYVLVFVDDYSRYVVAYFLKKKSEVANKFKTYLTMYENQWGEQTKCLRSDNGMGFQPERIRRAREPVLFLGHGPACENDSATDANDNSGNDNLGNDSSGNDNSGNDDSDNDGHF
ncbi:hypothetical protein PHMEG_0002150 [Phytophthora megakarya]|uniref:Integrase catalytic domain-containing protein n=1 Tax=Phytophthora megakarya TaxID=4795 RepID=A0A225X1D5_9STRA|nr:hypothetical protein PHMEG_0002150 [Phytophthora megakarya]